MKTDAGRERAAPFFSVVIPTFERSAQVVRAIESVLAQEFGDFEIVVIDDGSTDDTVQIIDSRFADEPRVRLIRQEHRERGAARNRGMAESTAEYVVFLDSDDLMKVHHLRTLHELIVEHPGVNFVATRFGFVGGDDPARQLRSVSRGWHGHELFLRGNPIGCNVCVRRLNSRLHRFRETEAYESEDWVFLVANLVDDRILMDDRSTILMRDHEARTMRGSPRDLIRAKESAVAWIEDNVSLSEAERQTMRGHADAFCSLHAHLAGDRILATKYLIRSLRRRGVGRSTFLLVLRIILGPRVITGLSKMLGRERR